MITRTSNQQKSQTQNAHQNVLHPSNSNSIHQRSFIYYKPVREIDVRGRSAGMRCGPSQTFLAYDICISVLCLYSNKIAPYNASSSEEEQR